MIEDIDTLVCENRCVFITKQMKLSIQTNLSPSKYSLKGTCILSRRETCMPLNYNDNMVLVGPYKQHLTVYSPYYHCILLQHMTLIIKIMKQMEEYNKYFLTFMSIIIILFIICLLLLDNSDQSTYNHMLRIIGNNIFYF